MQTLVFLGFIAVTLFYSFCSAVFFKRGGSYKLAWLNALGMWINLVYFYGNNGLSKFHMLWTFPITFFITMLIGTIMRSIILSKEYQS
jgi:hypothetical protein